MFEYRNSKRCLALAFGIGLLFISLGTLGAPDKPRDVHVQPDNPNVQYSGRWNRDIPTQPWLVWQGASIGISFDGTGISAIFDVGDRAQQFRVIIDGEPGAGRLHVAAGKAEYVLAKELPSGQHRIEIMKESFTASKTVFHGFRLDGRVLPPPPRPALRIEWFGDSNMDGTSNYSEKNNGERGTYYAYPAMVTRMLGAEMNLQAVGGATLDGEGDNNVRSFIYSEDFLNQDRAYRSGFMPHIIVVNAGANDINKSGREIVEQRYRDVVADLRDVYGATPHIVLMNSYGWDVREPANYSTQVAADIGGNLSVFLFPWLWEKWHGSQWDHSGQAHLLVDHLAAINPDWAQVNPADIVDGFGRNGDFANGSFEHAAPFGAFGWRYLDDGVERIHMPQQAADGDYYIRLERGEFVHQPTDATADFLPGGTRGGETYTISAMVRGKLPDSELQIITEFQGQQIWTRGDAQLATFKTTGEWRKYTASARATAGVWTLFNTFKASKGTVEIDDIRMSYSPGEGAGFQDIVVQD
jgi:hypothetical protein